MGLYLFHHRARFMCLALWYELAWGAAPRVLHVVPCIGSLALVHSNAILRVKNSALSMQLRALRLAFSHCIKRCQVRQHCSKCLVQAVVQAIQEGLDSPVGALNCLLCWSCSRYTGCADIPLAPRLISIRAHEPITEGIFPTTSPFTSQHAQYSLPFKMATWLLPRNTQVLLDRCFVMAALAEKS
jgi:hypothetical protein